jgi:hypothetical protein
MCLWLLFNELRENKNLIDSMQLKNHIYTKVIALGQIPTYYFLRSYRSYLLQLIR